jgi:hypothetical protein
MIRAPRLPSPICSINLVSTQWTQALLKKGGASSATHPGTVRAARLRSCGETSRRPSDTRISKERGAQRSVAPFQRQGGTYSFPFWRDDD